MTAPEKLAAYFDQTGIKKTWFAKRVGVKKATISRWLAGQVPTMTARLVIQDATDGAVKVEDWDNG